MASSLFVAVVGAISGVLGVALIGILAYFYRRQRRHSTDINSLKQSIHGTESEEGHLRDSRMEFESIQKRLDDLEDLMCSIERRRKEEHNEVLSAIGGIVSVLEREGLNGDLPEIDD